MAQEEFGERVGWAEALAPEEGESVHARRRGEVAQHGSLVLGAEQLHQHKARASPRVPVGYAGMLAQVRRLAKPARPRPGHLPALQRNVHVGAAAGHWRRARVLPYEARQLTRDEDGYEGLVISITLVAHCNLPFDRRPRRPVAASVTVRGDVPDSHVEAVKRFQARAALQRLVLLMMKRSGDELQVAWR